MLYASVLHNGTFTSLDCHKIDYLRVFVVDFLGQYRERNVFVLFYILDAVLGVRFPFPFGILGRIWNSIVCIGSSPNLKII